MPSKQLPPHLIREHFNSESYHTNKSYHRNKSLSYKLSYECITITTVVIMCSKTYCPNAFKLEISLDQSGEGKLHVFAWSHPPENDGTPNVLYKLSGLSRESAWWGFKRAFRGRRFVSKGTRQVVKVRGSDDSKRFRGGFVFKARRLVYHSSLGRE